VCCGCEPQPGSMAIGAVAVSAHATRVETKRTRAVQWAALRVVAWRLSGRRFRLRTVVGRAQAERVLAGALGRRAGLVTAVQVATRLMTPVVRGCAAHGRATR